MFAFCDSFTRNCSSSRFSESEREPASKAPESKILEFAMLDMMICYAGLAIVTRIRLLSCSIHGGLVFQFDC